MYCRKCDSEKPESEFPNNRAKRTGKGKTCLACMREFVRKWKEKNRDKVAEQQKRWYKGKQNSFD